MNSYKISYTLHIVCLLLFFATALFGKEAPLDLLAKSAILIDKDTGTALYEKNPDIRLPMASTTKVMTALVAYENGKDKFNEPVILSKKAGETRGSSYLKTNEKVLFGDLFKAALIVSSNEATVAMAEHISGSEEAFVELMNARAKSLGMKNTHYVNSHGLYAKEHYSTARDLAILARYVYLNYPAIYETARLGHGHPESIDALPRKNVVLQNKNKMLSIKIPGFPNAKGIGLKTGFVNEAGRCLVSAAENDGVMLIGVVLGSTTEYFNESAALMAYGFRNYDFTLVADSHVPAARISVTNGSAKLLIGTTAPIHLPAHINPTSGEITVTYEGEKLKAPIEANAALPGRIVIKDGDTVLLEQAAVAINSVKVSWIAVVLKWVLGVIFGILALILIVRIVNGAIAKNSGKRRNSVTPKV